MNRFSLFLIAVLLTTACSLFSSKSNIGVIAEVNKKQLLISDVVYLIPTGLPAQDSIALLRQYINTWALAHLMEAKALKELPKEQRDVSQAIEEYRRSLLVFQYEKMFVETRIDTSITLNDLTKTYQENSALFTLSEPIAKVRLIKISLDSPYLEMVRSLYRTKSIEETNKLEEMISSSAEKYETYNGQWIGASNLSKELPVSTEEVIRSIPRGYLECIDNFFAYYTAFIEVIPANSIGPIDYAETSIRSIILGKRKQQLLKNLEKEVLEEGWKNNQLKVYINENE
ncbi:MAG: hypothetical protein LBC84_03630 [Prevotellaceae bacterium]|jgi:hypothetical protein|nr:hypothetical protein [Prevotellaceae bacterium]